MNDWCKHCGQYGHEAGNCCNRGINDRDMAELAASRRKIMVQGNTDEGIWALVKMVLAIVGIGLLAIVAVAVGVSFLIGKAC